MFALHVQSAMPPHVTSGQIDIWFQDEMRIDQRGTQTRLWARKGTRPVVPPHANIEAMGHQLQVIAKRRLQDVMRFWYWTAPDSTRS